jgi:glutamate dehydrogenase
VADTVRPAQVADDTVPALQLAEGAEMNTETSAAASPQASADNTECVDERDARPGSARLRGDAGNLEAFTDADIAILEQQLRAGTEVGVRSRTTVEADGARLVCLLVGVGEPRLLSDLVPTFAGFGLAVAEQRRLRRHPGERPAPWLDRFDLLPATPLTGDAAGFDDALEAVLRGDAEVDGLNALALTAGLVWQQITVLRAYVRYLRQAGFRFSQAYIEQALVMNPDVARLLTEFFQTRFDPSPYPTDPDQRHSATGMLERRLERALHEVARLDHDRILRSLLALVRATLRTTWVQADGRSTQPPYLSIKLDPRRLSDFPDPRPMYEAWVYSPRFEGLHLRFGAVARGGVRWSDRTEDFRTEILGLAKAQAVKNAVIVPAGAKGGFVCKRLPDAADREAWLAEGVACYRTFVSALLELTDNMVEGRVVSPTDVVRHDGDDQYLVVAADKGTATFSDLANDVADRHGFWLGDAFASGGRTGYDHKAMGITARGAWESVKRHFRELGSDPECADFTALGIGDMSGDVFGNGMLLSNHVRLVAAFDHRHIFLDPDPDAVTSYEERRRLFAMPGSSWSDYNEELVSPGGGVHSRLAKSIPLNDDVRRRLGIDGSVDALSPDELIRAVLKAPVDLLWNGGIGTYVKAAGESHSEVGDKANDGVRVDAVALRCRVVGEGGNLGFTQRARVEYARAGGRINTDAIDNSAGVDTSDHEVNLKILLEPALRDGRLSKQARNELLAQVQDEVASLVLTHNYTQNLQLSMAEAHAAESLDRHASLIRFLEQEGYLHRAQDSLPDEAGLAELDAAGQGLSRPELCVLLAHSKTSLKDDLGASDVPDDPYLFKDVARYFPPDIRNRFRNDLARHPLYRQIVAMTLVNELVDHLGPGFVHRLEERTGAGTTDAVRAYIVTRDVFGLPAIWSSLREADAAPTSQAELLVLEDTARLLDVCAAWLVRNRTLPIQLAPEVNELRTTVETLVPVLTGVLDSASQADMNDRARVLRDAGVPPELADRVALLGPLASAFDVAQLSRDLDRDPVGVAAVYFEIGERLDLHGVRARLSQAPVDSHWTSIAKAALLDELTLQQRLLTAAGLAGAPADAPAGDVVGRWAHDNRAGLTRWDALVRELRRGTAVRLAPAVVAVQTLRDLATPAPARANPAP